MKRAAGNRCHKTLSVSHPLDSSPKGRALGKTKSFAVLPKPLPSGEVDLRSKDGEGEDAALNHAAGGLR